MDELIDEAIAEKEDEDENEEVLLGGDKFGLHAVMDDGEGGDEVDGFVEEFPAGWAEELDHAVGGGEGEGGHEGEGGDADEKIEAGIDFVEESGEARAGVVKKIDGDVDTGVEERIEAEGTSGSGECVPVSEGAERGDEEREQEEDDGEETGGEEGVMRGVGAELLVTGVPDEDCEGDCAVDGDDDFEGARIKDRCGGSAKREGDGGHAEVSELEVHFEIHALVERGDLFGVAVE